MTDELTWTAPGPGYWEWGGSHIPGVLTPIYGPMHQRTLQQSMTTMFERVGVPLGTLREEFVNGRAFTQLQPLVGKPGSKPPPKPVLWLATRLHPAFRARTKTAARTLGQRSWRARTEEWSQTLRPRQRTANLELQHEDLTALDDDALLEHLERAVRNMEQGLLLHFDLHGDDMGPLGLYLSRCIAWGLEPGDAIAAMAGHSPSTAAPVDALRKVSAALLESGWTVDQPVPTSLDALRSFGPSVSQALDEYLDEYGWRLVTGYDIDSRCVGELPEALVANVVAATDLSDGVDAAAAGDQWATRLRVLVPAVNREEFDELLIEARVALDLRDDNGPITVEWPGGLVRRALLEIGRRLAARERLVAAEHVVELDVPEIETLVRDRSGALSADDVAGRARARRAASAEVPPSSLGEREPEPDLSAFPEPLARMTSVALTAVALLERGTPAVETGEGVVASGLGVGSDAYTGRARVAHRAEDALAAIEPGDVLVVPFTTPAYNAVLTVCGAVITEEGGALAHAAVLARELGIPAVVGAAGALSAIADGDQVEVDPVAGTVRRVS
jgi:pyruvate,water dikinase